MWTRFTLALAAALIWAAPQGALKGAHAQTPDLALVLAVDVSGSVSEYEYILQMRGLSQAFRSRSVVNAIKSAAPNGVAVTLIQWSSMSAQAQLFEWMLVTDGASAAAVARRIDDVPRLVEDGATAISHALDFATLLLSGIRAQRRVIDISGDGRDNQSGEFLPGRERALAAGITINGLAILNEEPLLEYYYLTRVIGGEDAFVLGADDFDDFAEAMEIKLIKEISTAPMGDRRLSPPSYAEAAAKRRGG